MPLEKKVIGLNFTQGLDTRDDPFIVAPGKMLLLQNYTLGVNNSFTRRDGWDALVSTSSGTGNGLATFENELLVVDDRNLYSYSLGSGALASKGRISPLTLTREAVKHSDRTQTEYDIATSGTLTAYVYTEADAGWTTFRGVSLIIRDEDTGNIVFNQSLSTSVTAVTPRVCYVTTQAGGSDANCFIVAWKDGVNIKAISVNTSTLAASAVVNAATTVYNVVAGQDFIDMVTDQGNGLLVFVSDAAVATTAVSAIHIRYVAGVTSSASLAVVAIVGAVARDDIRGLCVAQFNVTGKFGVGITSNTTGTLSGILTTTSSTITTSFAAAVIDAAAPTNVRRGSRITATTYNSTTLAYIYDQADDYASGGVQPLNYTSVTVTNGIDEGPSLIINSNTKAAAGAQYPPSGPFIAGKAFTRGGVVYFPAYVIANDITENGGVQPTWFLLDLDGVVNAKALVGSYGAPFTGGGATTPKSSTPSSTPLIQTSYVAMAGEKSILTFATGTALTVTGLCRIVMQFFGAQSVPYVELGKSAFFAGGSLTAYDGVLPTEAGFHLFPEGITAATLAAGPPYVDAGVHQYVAVYEWTDAQGHRHQSGTAVPVSATIAATNQATIVIPTIFMSSKPNINIVVYRTKVAGTTFYRVNSIIDRIANDTTAASVTYIDKIPDASLGEVLYTTGGILANNGPPACSTLEVHQNRVFIGGLEQANQFQYSQPYVQNDFIGLQWNETLSGRVDPNGGAIVGLTSLDDKMIFSCERRHFAMPGQGPNTTGLQNGYSQPDEIISDAGCSESRSILKTPLGVIFKSLKGWHVLDRGLQVKYIGTGVEAYNTASVFAAVLLDDRKEARFYVDGSEDALVYSYLVDQWSTFATASTVDALWWPNSETVYWLTPTGGLRTDNALGLDNTTVKFNSSLETAWIRLQPLVHGFQRVYKFLLKGSFVGDIAVSNSTISIAAYYDYNDTIISTQTIQTNACALGSDSSWEFRWSLPIQKCQAVKFVITDTPDTSSVGSNLTSMSLEIGIKQGAAKLPAAQST